MKFFRPLLVSLFLSNSLAFGAPSPTFEMGATAPNGLGCHMAVSSFFGENLFLQARWEEGALPFGPKLGVLHHGLVGLGYEYESSSHLFFRLTAGAGLGSVYAPHGVDDGRSKWLQTIRLAPEMAWYPFGRFRDFPLGLNLGVNLQHRSDGSGGPVTGGLQGQSAQIFAGMVL